MKQTAQDKRWFSLKTKDMVDPTEIKLTYTLYKRSHTLYIYFQHPDHEIKESIAHCTHQNLTVVADFTQDGRLIGLELLSVPKPIRKGFKL